MKRIKETLDVSIDDSGEGKWIDIIRTREGDGIIEITDYVTSLKREQAIELIERLEYAIKYTV